MTANHTALKEVARKVLANMGYTPDEIKEEYSVGGYDFRKSFRVDVVGLKKDKRVAIECGATPGEKIAALKMYFDEVIVLPYFTLNIKKAEYERTVRIQSEEIVRLRERIKQLEAEIRNTDRRESIMSEIFKDCLELFSRIIRETKFYNNRYDQENIQIIEDMKQSLDSLKENLVPNT